MSIRAVVHWGMAEDVCIVVKGIHTVVCLDDDEPDIRYSNNAQIPMTKQEARILAEQLQTAADRCDELERGLDELENE